MKQTFRTLDFQPDPHRDLDEEIRVHLELTIEELEAKGLSPEEARARALLRFGELGAIREQAARVARRRTRRERALTWFSSVLDDVRFGVRGYLQTPGFTAVVILTLTLGMGTVIAIFTLVNGFLLKPLPFPNAEELVMIWEVDPEDGETMTVTPADFRDWAGSSTSFSVMAGFNIDAVILTGEGEEAQALRGSIVTEEFFRTLGTSLVLGPGFSPEHFIYGGPGAVILSHALWQQRYGSDPSVIGRMVRLDGEGVSVVGVLPPDYQHPDPSVEWLDAQILQPLTVSPGEMERRRGRWMRVIARLRPEVSLEQAQLELNGIADRIAQAHPESNEGWGARIVPFRDQYFGEVRPALLILLGTGGLVLLIVCVNLANLFLARSSRRMREFAIRSAIGSGRGRLGRQLLVEGLVAAMAGGTLGLAMTAGASGILAALKDRYFPSMADVGIDFRVVLFTIVVGCITVLLFSALPALVASRPGLASVLSRGGAGTGTGPSARRIREGLVLLEIALTAVLLFGATLLSRSFVELVSMPTGFSNRDVLTAEMRIPREHFASSDELYSFYERLQERVEGIPGVEDVSFAGDPPFTAWNNYKVVRLPGVDLPDEELPDFEYSQVGPSFFRILGTPLISGRTFDSRDRAGAPPVAVVNEALARELWGGRDPVGERMGISVRDLDGIADFEVVGMVGNIVDDGLDREAEPTFYIPFLQEPRTLSSILVQTRGNPIEVFPAVRQELTLLDNEIPLSSATTLASLINESVAVPRAALTVGLSLGILTLILAAVGVFGVVASAVAERRREIGIRTALGATGEEVTRMVLRRSLLLALGGSALGLLGAMAMGRILESLLFHVSARDPLTLLFTALILGGVATLASWTPARQASRVDPMVALRPE